MASVKFDGFRQGIDMRRLSIEAKPGALETLTNAYVGPGGDIEPLGSFLWQQGFELPLGCFGLEYTDAGFVTFGTGASPGTPAGLTYQRLYHPIYYQTAEDRAMTDVVYSCTFKGKAFVAAKFSDDRIALYYDGTLIDQSHEGEVLPAHPPTSHATILQVIATRVATALGRLGYRTYANVDIDNTSLDGSVILLTPTDSAAEFVSTVTSAAGDIVSRVVDRDGAATSGVGAPVVGVKARATFTVDHAGSASGVISVYAPLIADQAEQLLGTYTAPGATAAVVAANIAGVVNAKTADHGFVAAYLGAVVTIYAPLDQGDFKGTDGIDENLHVVCTDGLTASAGGTEVPEGTGVSVDPTNAVLTVTLQKPKDPEVYPGSLQMSHEANWIGTVRLGRIAIASISGWAGQPTYKWEPQMDGEKDLSNGFTIKVRHKAENGTAQANEAEFTLQTPLRDEKSYIGYFQCVATCGAAPPITTKFFVKVTIT